MRFPRTGRSAHACFLSLLATLATGTSLYAQSPGRVTGNVVDETGRAVPRAHVRALSGSGTELAWVFADETGRFRVTVDDPRGCRIEVVLTGFQTATAACQPESAGSLRVVLQVAPIREAVVVSATRTDAPGSQIGASATVFTADDLNRRQMPLVADLLQLSPGTMVTRNGGLGSLTSLFVRGGESDYNKVLLDGVPLNEPGGNFYFNNLTTENLERVEIVRGAYSALFGSDAMASVVQLFTARPDGSTGRPRITAQLDGGTYDTFHANVSASGNAGRVGYNVGAARLVTDNRVPNSKFENTTLSANVGVALGPDATLRFIGRGEFGLNGVPGLTAFGPADLNALHDRHDGMGAIVFDQRVTRTLRQRISYSIARSLQQSSNLTQDPPYVPTYPGHTAQFESSDFLYDTVNNLKRHHLSYQTDWRVAQSSSTGDHLLTFVADWDGERATLESRLEGARNDASRNNFGVSAEYQALWPRIFATVGGRIERNASFGTEAVPRATIAVVAFPGSGSIGSTLLKSSFGMGIKEPSITESFGVSFFARGNPNLEPERSRSFEVGVDQRLANDHAKLAVAYFDNRFEDIIWTETTDFTTFEGEYRNVVGLSRARGLEMQLEMAPFPVLRGRGGYTFLASKIEESSAQTVVFQEGEWAFRRPRHSGFVGVTLDWQRLTVDVSGLFIGRTVDSDFFVFDPPITEVPARTTWDTRVAYELTSRLSAIVAVDNLTDTDYMQPVGYQSLGRVVRAGVQVRY